MRDTLAPQEVTLQGLLGFSGPDAPPESVIRACVHCGFCLPACPTYRITNRERSSPRGRIALIRHVSEGRLDLLDPIFVEEMQLCLNCRACESACPSGVKYGELVESARAQIEDARMRPMHERVARKAAFRGAFGSSRRFRGLAHALRIYQRSGAQRVVRGSKVLRPLGLSASEAMLPAFDATFVIPGREVWSAMGTRRGRVALLSGCIMSTVYADVHRATARVLARNGFDVEIPVGQQCCGALSIHSGDLEGGRALAKANIDALLSNRYAAIIVNAAGCGAAMKEYDFLLRNDPAYAERAAELSGRIKDPSQFLAEHGLTAPLGPMDITVTYQDACHLAHAQRITAQPRELLLSIPGLSLIEMPESALCCGSAGIYNVLQPEMAGTLLKRKLDNALTTQAMTIVSANPGCMMQMQAGLRARGLQVEVVHLMTLLDRAYAAQAADIAAG